MGQSESVTNEVDSWTNHNMKFRKSSKFVNAGALINKKIKLAFIDRNAFGLDYKHFFLFIDDQFIAEMEGDHHATAMFKVHNKLYDGKYNIVTQSRITEHMLRRLVRMLGFTGYSLMLRNCEHVSNYIYTGRWISEQTYQFKGLLNLINKTEYKRLINTPPAGLGPIEDVYEFKGRSLNGFRLISTSFQQPAAIDNLKTILLIGPTGSGKSRIIEATFGLTDLSSAGLSSVTSDILFHFGEFDTDKKGNNKICLIDTIGLCDSKLSHVDVTKLMMNRIHRVKIDLVFLCLSSSNRLSGPEREAIDQMLYYLGESDMRVIFTKSDQVTIRDIARLRSDILDIYPRFKDSETVIIDKSEVRIPKVFNSSLKDPDNEESRSELSQLLLTPSLKSIVITLDCWDHFKSKIGLS